MKRFMSAIATTLLCTSAALATEPWQPVPDQPRPADEVACVGADALKSTNTPADLYRNGAACIRQGKRQDAALALALAGVYCQYDTLRINEQTASEGCKLLRTRVLGDLEKRKRDEFKETLKMDALGAERAGELCRQIEKIGPPQYSPSYMAQFGLHTLFAGGKDPLAGNAERKVAWAKSLKGYLHCP